MKFFIAFALLAVAAADVSHLFNAYLPPSSTTNSHGESTDIHTTNSASSHEIDNTAPAISYGAPAVRHSFSGSVYPATFSTGSFSAPLVHNSFAAAPSFRYSAPAFHSTYSVPSVQTTYSAGPAVSYAIPSVRESYSAPAFQSTFSAPALESYAAPHIHTTYHAAPSVSYTTSDEHSSVSDSHDHESTSDSDVGTQYAADGGYIY